MDRTPCNICKKDCIPYAPTHRDENDDPVSPPIIHEEKFCKKCLIDKFLKDEICPAHLCGCKFLCPPDVEKAIELAEDNDEDYVPPEENNKSTPMDIEDGDDKDPNFVSEKNSPKRRLEDNIAQPPKKTVKNFARGAAKKPSTIKQLAEQQIIPEVHCAWTIGKASKDFPNRVCVETVISQHPDNGLYYCAKHFAEGPLHENYMKRLEQIDNKKRKNTIEKKYSKLDDELITEEINVTRKTKIDEVKLKENTRQRDILNAAKEAIKDGTCADKPSFISSMKSRFIGMQ